MTMTSQLSENSHRGVEGLKAALYLSSNGVKSNTAVGMQLRLRSNCTGSRSSGKERDAETGLDYFLARYYSGAQGRFMSPDEFKGGPDDALTGKDITPDGPLPYADISNPQSLNKYAYVYNNPLNLTDPDGHCPLCITALIGAGTGAVASMISQKMFHPDKPINWKAVGASAVGGAVAGATLGVLAAPASIVTLGGETVLQTGLITEAGAGVVAGVAGGIANRAVTSGGDLTKAIGASGQIIGDAISGSAGPIIKQTVVNPVIKESTYIGRAVSVGEEKLARGVKASPGLPMRQEQLKEIQKLGSIGGSIAIKVAKKKIEEDHQ
jgi:RHS repeat-associated protein